MKWQEYEVIYTVASFLLLLISLVMVTRRKLAGLAAGFLKLYFLAFFLATFISYLINYKYALGFPHVFRTGHIFTVLIMPFSYFYVLQNLYPRKLRSRYS